jgi:hypothetical protein
LLESGLADRGKTQTRTLRANYGTLSIAKSSTVPLQYSKRKWCS